MTDAKPPGFEARDQALADALDRYVRELDSGASRQTSRTVLRWWLRDILRPNGWDAVDVLDDADQGEVVLRRTAQALAKRIDDADDRLSSPSSARTYFDVVSGAVASMTADGLLKESPARLSSVRRPLPSDPGETDTQQFWSPEQRSRLVEFVDERAREAIDEHGTGAVAETRDRAVVALVAWTGVRGVEVFASRRDDRDGRDGLQWRRVDLEDGVIRVRGKSGEFEDVGIPRQALPALEQWATVLEPAPEWPVVPTLHRPTLAQGLPDDVDRGDGWLAAYREASVVPPALTVDGARSLVERLSVESGAADEEEPLKLHGARRGLGESLYRKSPATAQEQLRHKSIETTKESYSHIDAAEQADVVSDLLDEE